MTSIFVSEIFKSIQGEGPHLGTPSIFLRLGICNLQCSWCDTPYTWKKGFTDYKSRTLDWIEKKIREFKKGTSIQHLVITGGEPLLQQKQLSELLEYPLFRKMDIEIETNASMSLLHRLPAHITFNISPKLADSDNKPYKIHMYPNSVLKFVYINKKSEVLIDDFLKKNLSKVKNIPIFIMPEGTTVAAMEPKYKAILNYCMKRGFRFTPRLHLYLFGNQRAT